MSLPPYPSSPGADFSPPQPGLYPLRPLRIGEILGAAFRVAKRHIAVLAPISVVFLLLAAAAEILVLSANGSLHQFATGTYTVIPAKATSAELNSIVRNLWGKIIPAFAVSLVLGLIAAPILAGIATPFAALGATSRTSTNGAGLARLRGRLPVLLGLGVVVGVAIAIGYLLLIVPGVLIWLTLMPAGPVAAMERSPIGDSIKRAMVVSKGFRGRLFGVSLLVALISGAISYLVSTVLANLVSGSDTTPHLFVTQAISILVGAVLTPWSSCVVAMLYIDIRMRREGLAQALLAAAGPSPFS